MKDRGQYAGWGINATKSSKESCHMLMSLKFLEKVWGEC